MKKNPNYVLRPHSEQDGFVYIRVKRDGSPIYTPSTHDSITFYTTPYYLDNGMTNDEVYIDSSRNARTISSRRVEEAVEVLDFLKKCDEDGYTAEYDGGQWEVFNEYGESEFGNTLREAYYRTKNINVQPIQLDLDDFVNAAAHATFNGISDDGFHTMLLDGDIIVLDEVDTADVADSTR